MTFPANGGVIDWLTGGRLKAVVGMLLADPQALENYAHQLTEISALLEAPKNAVALARNNLKPVWESETGELAVRDLDILGICLSDTKTGLLDFGNSVRKASVEIKEAQDKCNRIIEMGSRIAQAQLALSWLGGYGMAVMTAFGVIAGVAAVIIMLVGKLNKTADDMLDTGLKRAESIKTRAELVAPNADSAPETALVTPNRSVNATTMIAAAGRTPTVFDRK